MEYTVKFGYLDGKGGLSVTSNITYPSRGEAVQHLPKSGRVFVTRDHANRTYVVIYSKN